MIHATSETPTLVRQSEEYEVNYKLAETYSLNDIRYLTPQQRKCRFEDEPLTNNVPVYSNSICTMECRYRLAMEKCGCRPFFYLFLGKFSIHDEVFLINGFFHRRQNMQFAWAAMPG